MNNGTTEIGGANYAGFHSDSHIWEGWYGYLVMEVGAKIHCAKEALIAELNQKPLLIGIAQRKHY